MSVVIEPITEDFVARCHGVDLTSPLDASTVEAIVAAFNRYAVVIFNGPPLSIEQQLAFSSHFGNVETSLSTLKSSGPKRLGDALVSDISNLSANNEIAASTDRKRLFNLANQLWHSDSSFKEVPATYSMLDAHVVPPEGGDTEFADMRAAWDRLPDAYRKRIHDLYAEHSQIYSREALGFKDMTDEERRDFAPVRQRLVRYNEGSARWSLFLSSHIGLIEDWSVPESIALIRDLMERATLPQYVYRHKWAVGDLVVWDNRCTLHRARPAYEIEVEYPRDLRRVTLAGATSSITEPRPA